MTTKLATREQEFFRSLRPPELRDAPDEWYQAIAREATRIARAHKQVQRIQRSMEDARYAIERGVWPRIYYRDWLTGRISTEHRYSDYDPVTCCWLVDVCADTCGYAPLDKVQALNRSCGNWLSYNHAVDWGVVGSLRSNSSAGLVIRVAPVTWALTDRGRELMALVFGDADDA